MQTPRCHLPRTRSHLWAATGACAALLLSSAPLLALDYYVSPTGLDSNPGTELQPFATIAKAVSKSVPANSTNTIYLKRGAVFREAPPGSLTNRHLRAYGDAAQPAPVWSGSDVVTGFAAVAGKPGVFSATFTGGTPAQVYVNGSLLTLARYPNAGWLFSDANTGHNSIQDAALNSHPGDADGFWVGAQVRWRKWSWWYETRPITGYAQATATLTLGGSSTLPHVAAGTGFYLENRLDLLDAPGEWYWDATNTRLYVYPPAGVSLSTALVEAAVRTNGPTLSTGSSIDGLTVKHFTNTGILAQRPVTIENCLVEHIGNVGVNLSWDSAGSVVRNCTLRDVYNRGVVINQNPTAGTGTLIQRNTFLRIGMVPALSGNSSQQAIGIDASNSNGPVIELNRFNEIGYCGVNVHQSYLDSNLLPTTSAHGVIVRKNFFRRTMATLNDGAAIRFVSDYNKSEENIVLDTIGELVSSQPWTPLGHGVWLEFVGKPAAGGGKVPFTNNRVLHTTVYGSNGHGIFVTAQKNGTLNSNVLVSNRNSALHYTIWAGQTTANHYAGGNIYAIGAQSWAAQPDKTPERLAPWASTYETTISYVLPKDASNNPINIDYGTTVNSVFVNRAGDNYLRRMIKDGPASNQTIPQWQTTEPDWADPAPLAVSAATYLFVNDTETSGSVTLPSGVTWQRLDGTPITGSSVWVNTFRSTLLVAAGGNTAGLQPYYLKSQQ